MLWTSGCVGLAAAALIASGCGGSAPQGAERRGARIGPSSAVAAQSHERRAAGYGSVWKVHPEAGTVMRIDRRTGAVETTIHLRLPRPILTVAGRCPPGCHAFLPLYIALGHGAAWVASDRGWVAEVDAASNRVVQMIRTPDGATDGIASGGRYVWVVSGLAGVIRIDPATGRRTQVPICLRRCRPRGGKRLDVIRVATGHGQVVAVGAGWHGPPAGTWRSTPRVRWPGLPRRRIGVESRTRQQGVVGLRLRS